MIKKILIPSIVVVSLAISGCQELPPGQNPNPNVETPSTPPKDIQTEKIVYEKVSPNFENKDTEQPQVVTAAETKPQKIKFKAYFPDDAGISLVAVNRTAEVKDVADKYLAAIKALMVAPAEKDLTAIFPKNTKINGVTFKDGTAYVDFDSNITKSFAGGSTGEELLVGSVVKTLTEFKEVKQVRFLLDGQEIETLSGHMDLSTPIKESDL